MNSIEATNECWFPLGASHPVVVPDIEVAWVRCRSVAYYLLATNEYRSRLDDVMTQIVHWNREHKSLTYRSSTTMGDLGEFYAIKALGLAQAPEREEGFDAWDRDGRRVEIKCRQVHSERVDALDERSPLRVRLDSPWDCLALVLVDSEFRLSSISKMDRDEIERRWVRNGAPKRSSLPIRVRSFIREASEVFGPHRYHFLSRIDREWRHKLPGGKLRSAVPHEIGQPAAHLESLDGGSQSSADQDADLICPTS